VLIFVNIYVRCGPWRSRGPRAYVVKLGSAALAVAVAGVACGSAKLGSAALVVAAAGSALALPPHRQPP